MADQGIVRKPSQDRGDDRQRPGPPPTSTTSPKLLWSFAPTPRPVSQRPAASSDVPFGDGGISRHGAREIENAAGSAFVGPTTAYALMQATGMVDDHLRACWVPSTVS